MRVESPEPPGSPKHPTPKNTDAVAELAPGRDVLSERYRLERPLGRDEKGYVWLAIDRELGVRRGLRFLPWAGVLASAELEELEEETRRCKKLAHQNIVQIYDLVQDDEYAAICMEAIDGPDLSVALRRRVPPCFHPQEIRFWMEELCRALHYAHNFREVVHGYLRPSNLLIDKQCHLKVAGFGFARVNARLCGLPEDGRFRLAVALEYMSPQQIDGEAPAVSDDIYGFGATLFELLTGRPPFVGGDICEQVGYQPAPSLRETRRLLGIETAPISADWETLVQACLAKEPENRPESVRQVAEMLDLDLAMATATMRDPVVPSEFMVQDGAPGSWAGPRETRARSDELTARLTKSRREPARRDLPAGPPDCRELEPWKGWPALVAGGILASGLVTNLAFCGLQSSEETMSPRVSQVREAVMGEGTASVERAPAVPLDPVSFGALENVIRAEDWGRAGELVEGLIAAGRGREPMVLAAQARIQVGLEHWRKALATSRALLEMEPNHGEATVMKARIHAALGEWYAVRHAVRWALAQPENAAKESELLLLRGRANRKLGHLREAVADYGKVIRAEGKHAKAYYERGLAHRDANSVPKAMSDFTTAIELDPQRVEARRARALLALQEGRSSQSMEAIIEDLSYVIDANPHDIDIRLDRLRCSYHAQQWEGVIEDSEALLGYDPDWMEVRRLRAVALVKRGEGTVLPKEMKLYLEQYPDDIGQWLHLAGALLRARQPGEAKDAYTQVIRRDPRRFEAYQGRALAYYGMAQDLEKVETEAGRSRLMRRLGLHDLGVFLALAPDLATADTYLLKTKLHFYLGQYYPEADAAARAGRERFASAREEFEWWIQEIDEANAIEKGKLEPRRLGRPDVPEWFEGFEGMAKREEH